MLMGFSVHTTYAQDKPAYQLFLGSGKKLSYKKLLKQAKEADVILFGELHNDPIAHWLQLEILKDLAEQEGKENYVLGSEMFERHQAADFQAFLDGEIKEKELKEKQDLWPNYYTDYRPLVLYAQAQGIPFVATNVPRKYARQVARMGLASLDTLSEEEKAEIAPLPITVDFELPSYAAMRTMMGGHGGGMNMDNFIAAQAIKDATMAYFILENWSPGKTFYHLNGAYHSDDKEGIAWYLTQANPALNLVNFTVVQQADLNNLEAEYRNKADVIIVVPETMTRTY